jgi:hypothetical protein
MLEHSDVATRLPVQDLKRARSFYAGTSARRCAEATLGWIQRSHQLDHSEAPCCQEENDDG